MSHSKDQIMRYVRSGTNPVNEVYEVVRTFDFNHQMKAYRIEIRRDWSGRDSRYDCIAYRLENNVWTRWEGFPWVDRDTEEGALGQAIGWLRERLGLELGDTE